MITPKEIKGIIEMRKEGNTLMSIADAFNVNYSVVQYHVDMYQQEYGEFPFVKKTYKKRDPLVRQTGLNGLNKGKTYRQYLLDDKRKKNTLPI